MFRGLLIASLGSMLAFSAYLFPNGFSSTKIVLMTVGIVIAWFYREGKLNRLYVKACAFYLACFIPSFFVTPDINRGIFGFYGLYSGGLLSAFLCCSGFVLSDSLSPCDKSRLTKAIHCAGVLLFFVCFAQAARVDPFAIGAFDQDRSVGLIGNSLEMGMLFVALFSFSMNPLYLLGIWFCGSRAAIIGAAVALLPIKYRVHGFIIATIIGVLFAVRASNASDTQRLMFWKAAAQHITFIGTGPVTYEYTFAQYGPKDFLSTSKSHHVYAHNTILEAGTTKGIFGLLALLVVLLAPQTAGVWTAAMFNPISFVVVFISCVLAGAGPKYKLGEK